MLVFIHSKFKIDLTYLQVTFNEENQWFKDDISTEISFPFEFYLDSELSKNSGFESHYNSANNVRIFSGILDRDGVMVDAILKFENIIGKKVSAIIKAGTESFPSFDKKLSELPLEKKAVADLWQEARETISKEYPETNYNFKMIHTDKYSNGSNNEFNGFEKIINNYRNGDWVANVLDTEENIDVIKNIIQPLPYQMHILKTGIESEGYKLEGDILYDEDINSALVIRDGDYYIANSKAEIPIQYNNNEFDALDIIDNTFQYVKFEKEIVVKKKGDYLIYGSIYSLVCTARKNPAWSHKRYRCSRLNIKIEKISGGVITNLFNVNLNREDDGTTNLWYEVRDDAVEVPVSFNVGDIIKITKLEPKRDYIPSLTPEYPEAVSLSLIPLRFRNPDGSPILAVLPLNEIDLTRVVPDMSFRDFVLVIKNWGNYGFVADGKTIIMDRIGEKLDRTKAIDFSEFDILEPKRIFSDDRFFEIAFSDGKGDEKYKYDSVLVSKDQTLINNYTAPENVSSIKIDALPLPVITRDSITTAHNFEDQTTKLRLAYSKRMTIGGSPVCYLNKNVLIPYIAEKHFKKWLNFRINSIEWEWDFIISVEKLREVSMQSIIYAYCNYHLFSSIQKERLNKLHWRVTAKSESLL